MTMESVFDFREIDCPVCGSDSPAFVGWRGGEAHQSGAGEKTAIVRCSNCTHQYPNPMPFPRAKLDELYVNAETYFQGHDLEKKKEMGRDLMRKFESKLGRKGSFLDVGCGVGEILWAAQDEGWDAEGVDPSAEFVKIGRETLNVNSKVTTLEDASYPEDSFDAISMSSLIEHLYDPYSTLKEINRVLKPNGWLWFDAPNEDGLYMKAGNFYMKLRRKEWVVVMAPTFAPYHVQGFNPSSIMTVMKRANFHVRDLEIVGEVCPQQGDDSIRKKIEFSAARVVNVIGRALGRGTYMNIWAQRSDG